MRDRDQSNKGNLVSVCYGATLQELPIPMHKKLGRNGKGLACLSKDLLAKIKGKKQMCRQGKQG